jgi:predicted aspartyl protease
MANDVRLICWPTPDRLGLGIQVRNLAGQSHHQTEESVQIDTGYSEELLIPQALFESLNLPRWQLPTSVAAQGTTVTGQIIKFSEAPVDVIIPKTGEHQRVIAQTFAGNIRFLIGRAFLRRFQVLFDGPGDQTCLLTSDIPQ